MMKTLESLLIRYAVWLCEIWDITPEQIERSKGRRTPAGLMRPEGARGFHC